MVLECHEEDRGLRRPWVTWRPERGPVLGTGLTVDPIVGWLGVIRLPLGDHLRSRSAIQGTAALDMACADSRLRVWIGVPIGGEL